MSLVGSVSSIPRMAADAAVSTRPSLRGGETEPTRRMSPELQAAFDRAYDAWQRRQEQLTIFAQQPASDKETP